MSRLSDELTDDLRQLDYAGFEELDKEMAALAEAIVSEADDPERYGPLSGAVLYERLRDIVYHCRLDPFRELIEEYKRRLRGLKEQQFLSYFLKKNPGAFSTRQAFPLAVHSSSSTTRRRSPWSLQPQRGLWPRSSGALSRRQR